VQTRSLKGHPERLAILRNRVPALQARAVGELFRDLHRSATLDLGVLSQRDVDDLQKLSPELELVLHDA
jgi:hypothetical protein